MCGIWILTSEDCTSRILLVATAPIASRICWVFNCEVSHYRLSLNIYLRIPEFLAQHKMPQAFRYIFVGPGGSWSFLTAVDGKELFRLQLVGVEEDALERIDVCR